MLFGKFYLFWHLFHFVLLTEIKNKFHIKFEGPLDILMVEFLMGRDSMGQCLQTVGKERVAKNPEQKLSPWHITPGTVSTRRVEHKKGNAFSSGGCLPFFYLIYWSFGTSIMLLSSSSLPVSSSISKMESVPKTSTASPTVPVHLPPRRPCPHPQGWQSRCCFEKWHCSLLSVIQEAVRSSVTQQSLILSILLGSQPHCWYSSLNRMIFYLKERRFRSEQLDRMSWVDPLCNLTWVPSRNEYILWFGVGFFPPYILWLDLSRVSFGVL